MPSFSESIFLFFLALIFFGPKKLPVLARELGKWLAEFRRASNEFKMQMEDELRAVEQADKEKKAEDLVASQPSAADLPASTESAAVEPAPASTQPDPYDPLIHDESYNSFDDQHRESPAIATSGDLSIMPPETGLPAAYGEHPPAEAIDLSPSFEKSSSSGLNADGTRPPEPSPAESPSEGTHG